jgi:hypothetical protein
MLRGSAARAPPASPGAGVFATGPIPLTHNEAVTTSRHLLKRVSSRSVPAGIYGTIICASILGAAGPDTPSLQVAISVLVTLLVYWLAERYSEVLGLASSPDHAGPYEQGSNRITAAHMRQVTRSGWAMIQASVTPLVVLFVSRVLGADNGTAVNIALGYTVLLLASLGWLAANRAGLSGWPRALAAGFSTLLGLLVVILKASLH